MMNSIVNHMGKYDHRQHVLSDWLAELKQRFQLREVNTDKAKITWCQLLIGATGSNILAGLEDDASWEVAKETLLSRLGIGSIRDEAWAALKQLKTLNACIPAMTKRQSAMPLTLFSVLSIAPWRQKSRNSDAVPWRR